VKCFMCHGVGHYSRHCPLRKTPNEVRGSSLTVSGDPADGSSGDVAAEFRRLQ